MKNALALKVYEVDYSFIIKNYLDKKLWSKSWTLFVYNDYVFTINLSSIDVKNNTIVFEVKCDKLRYCFEADVWNREETIRHNIENSNITVLKKQINGAISRLIEKMERIEICESEEYKQILDSIYEEKEQLRNIAKDYLDDNGVSNEDIRDAYIDSYVYKNSEASKYKNDYMATQQYNVLTDLYLVFYKAIKDEDKVQTVLENIDGSKAKRVLEQVEEHLKEMQTEEYTEDLKNNLEEI